MQVTHNHQLEMKGTEFNLMVHKHYQSPHKQRQNKIQNISTLGRAPQIRTEPGCVPHCIYTSHNSKFLPDVLAPQFWLLLPSRPKFSESDHLLKEKDSITSHHTTWMLSDMCSLINHGKHTAFTERVLPSVYHIYILTVLNCNNAYEKWWTTTSNAPWQCFSDLFKLGKSESHIEKSTVLTKHTSVHFSSRKGPQNPHF